MAVKIRLSRVGAKKRPSYHIVAADARSPRDGDFLEKLGRYNPLLPAGHDEKVVFKDDRVNYWLSVGAQPTKVVERIMKKRSA